MRSMFADARVSRSGHDDLVVIPVLVTGIQGSANATDAGEMVHGNKCRDDKTDSRRPVNRLISRAVGGVLAVLAAGSALALEPEVADQLEAEQRRLADVGRAIVTEHCARCHAVGMDDQSPHAEAPPFRTVVDRYPSEDLAEALAEGLVSGHPDMPVFQFSVPQIEGFIAYLDDLYLQGLAPPPAVGEEK